jgi:hypothetical protein
MEPDQVEVGWYDNPIEAELARCRLETEGIAAWAVDCSALGTGWFHPGQRAGIVLLTRGADAADARALLDEIEAEYEPEIPEEYADQANDEVCPACRSAEKVFEPKRPAEYVAEVLIDRAYRQGTGPHWRCRKCGHRWLAPPLAGDGPRR